MDIEAPIGMALPMASKGRKDSAHDLLERLHSAGPSWRFLEEVQTPTNQQPDLPQTPPHIDRGISRRGLEENKLCSTMTRSHSRPPRVLMVTRRHNRKNKYVDIVGEYHLELVQEHGGAPIIIPRTTKTVAHLGEYLPMDGLIVAEGNDLSPEILKRYGCAVPGTLDPELASKFASDTELDVPKDEIEFALMRYALAAGCPILALCRGSQMLNALRGGTLVTDIGSEIKSDVIHIRGSSDPLYDDGRHPIAVEPNTPLAEWFRDSLGETRELSVNTYHHMASKTLGRDLKAMAFAPDGVMEGFYDPNYNPEEGRFVVGLQFHPERMLSDYPGCQEVYKCFAQACQAYKRTQDLLYRH